MKRPWQREPPQRWADAPPGDGAEVEDRVAALFRGLPREQPLPRPRLAAQDTRALRTERAQAAAAAWLRAAVATAVLFGGTGAVFARRELAYAFDHARAWVSGPATAARESRPGRRRSAPRLPSRSLRTVPPEPSAPGAPTPPAAPIPMTTPAPAPPPAAATAPGPVTAPAPAPAPAAATAAPLATRPAVVAIPAALPSAPGPVRAAPRQSAAGGGLAMLPGADPAPRSSPIAAPGDLVAPPLPPVDTAAPPSPGTAAAAPPLVTAPLVARPARDLPPSITAPRGAVPPPTALAGEAALLREALLQLRQERHPRGALETLDQHRIRFPDGRLTHEVAVARVEALLALDRRAEALRVLESLPLDEVGRGDELRVIRGELRAPARCAAALADFDRVLERRSTAALEERALHGRAACRLAAGNEAEALSDLRSYLTRFPHGRFAATVRQKLSELAR